MDAGAVKMAGQMMQAQVNLTKNVRDQVKDTAAQLIEGAKLPPKPEGPKGNNLNIFA